MRKFKHPVSMYLTVRDIKDSNFIQAMDKLGYKVVNLNSINSKALTDRLFLHTNVGQKDVSFQWHAVYKDKNHIEHSDPNLFVTIAAMRVGSYFYKHEILVKKDGAFTCTFKSFTSNPDLFYCFEDSSIRDVKDFRKASREEIIEHFKHKPMKSAITFMSGDIVECSVYNDDFHKAPVKGRYIGIDSVQCLHVVNINGSYQSFQFIRHIPAPKKVTRAEIAKLLNVDEFEIID